MFWALAGLSALSFLCLQGFICLERAPKSLFKATKPKEPTANNAATIPNACALSGTFFVAREKEGEGGVMACFTGFNKGLDVN